MEGDYPLDDTEFYDGLEDDPGKPYPTIYENASLGRLGVGYLVERPDLAPAPEPPVPLLTPEEFTHKYNLKG